MRTDMDPCAIAEAGETAKINGLSYQFTVLDLLAEEINWQFYLIAAKFRISCSLPLSDISGVMFVYYNTSYFEKWYDNNF